MIVKVTFHEMYAKSPKSMVGYGRLAERIIGRITKAVMQRTIGMTEDEAFIYDGYSEAAETIPAIEAWANENEFMIDSIVIERIGG